MENNREVSRLTGLMGLARRAGKVVFGFDASVREINSGRARLTVIACDISQRTLSKLRGTCEDAKIPVVIIPITAEMLGAAIGREKTAVSVITDDSFAKRLTELAALLPGSDDKQNNNDKTNTNESITGGNR